MRRASLVLLAVLACAAARLGARPDAQTSFRGGIELATIGVTVSDRAGRVVTDLSADDFELLEDGRPQLIRTFARGSDVVDPAPPLHLGLLFDTSGSMRDDIGLARSAAVRFLNTFPDAKDMALVEFATEVRIARYGQGDFPRMVERIRAGKPAGETAMYDALGTYLDSASDDDGRTILLLYTDGGDTRSSSRFDEVLTLVKASPVTIYAVGFLEHQPARARLEQRRRLEQIARASGGQAFFPSSMKDVEAAYERVVQQIRGQYTLGFLSTNTKQDGTWRTLEVRVRKPGLSGVRLLARQGYFAPLAR